MPDHARQWIQRLTPREREVFEDLVVGHSNKAIANRLSISHRTVEIHRARVIKKAQAQSLPHLVRMAHAIGKWAGQNKKMAAQVAQRIERLTPREREAFDALVVCHSSKEIAAKLNISARTAEFYRARVIKKMQAQSLAHLVRMALAIEAEQKE